MRNFGSKQFIDQQILSLKNVGKNSEYKNILSVGKFWVRNDLSLEKNISGPRTTTNLVQTNVNWTNV